MIIVGLFQLNYSNNIRYCLKEQREEEPCLPVQMGLGGGEQTWNSERCSEKSLRGLTQTLCSAEG